MTVEGSENAELRRSRHAAPDPNPEGVPAANPEKARRFSSGFSSLRDVLSFIAGVVIIGHEVFFQNTVEIAILTVGVALAGLPVVFGADEKRKPPP